MGKLLLLSACLAFLKSGAQLAKTPVTLIYPSLTTYSKQFKDPFCFRSNTASLAGVQKPSAGLFSERRFLLQELSTYSLAAALPTKSGSFGLRGDYAGGPFYNEATLGLAYGRNTGKTVDIGVQFLYHSSSAAGYGAAMALTFDAGLLLHLTEAVQAGLSVYNPVRMRFGKSGEERLPAIYAAGIGYDASPQFFIGAEVQKVENNSASINAGLQYLFAENMMARAGFASATTTYYIGFGYQFKALRADVTATMHPYLGITPGLLLIYSPKK